MGVSFSSQHIRTGLGCPSGSACQIRAWDDALLRVRYRLDCGVQSLVGVGVVGPIRPGYSFSACLSVRNGVLTVKVCLFKQGRVCIEHNGKENSCTPNVGWKGEWASWSRRGGRAMSGG